MAKENKVEELPRIESYEDMMRANAGLMEEVYTDSKLTAAEKLKTFSIGVRNTVLLSRDMQARRKELMSYGIKANNVAKSLIFEPTEVED